MQRVLVAMYVHTVYRLWDCEMHADVQIGKDHYLFVCLFVSTGVWDASAYVKILGGWDA